MTALITFLRNAFSVSSTSTVPCSLPLVVDIFAVGSWRSITRPPISGIRCSGSTTIGDPGAKRSLKRRAISRINSTCWRWSSPTGTSSAL